MTSQLYLVRHAHSDYTPDELRRPLSVRGYADAVRVTEVLKGERIDYVYSSPYRRALQTVEGIAEYIGKEILIEDNFKERTLAASPLEDFQAAITKVWRDEDFSWEGGESNRIAQQRGVNVTKQVLRRHPGKKVVIGTHGNLMALIMNYYNKDYGFDFWKSLDMPDIYLLTFFGENLINISRKQ
ncbi:histidine phosphatase family protein [Bacillus mesophilum]|uniref:Histidine phosphatase family protein n=2 Tax=Bacillus mesophilum TaxID=1071718 RepID=A0A7V7UTS5_9BACI|nr:histidine phosphatase family protein [Bacillus mesophilum]KAB2330727.1 histidine phosphatase family protein [Bacillus mesophilum]